MRTTFKTQVTDADSGATSEAILTVVSIESAVLVPQDGCAIYSTLVARTMDGSPMITIHGPFKSEDDAERFLQGSEIINARSIANGKGARFPQLARDLPDETKGAMLAAIMGDQPARHVADRGRGHDRDQMANWDVIL